MPNLKNKVVTYMTLSADASTCNSPSQVYAKKSDANSRYLVVRIVDANGNIDVQGNAQLNATKPDGTHVYVGGDTNDDGTVTILLKSSVLALDGKVSCDITVFDKEDNETVILTTSTFFILVADSNYKADALESTNEFSMSAEMIAQVAEDRRVAEHAREEAGEALMNIENVVSQGGLANALKGNASGEAVRVDDVSPFARNMSVKVSGVDDVSAVTVTARGKNFCNIGTVEVSAAKMFDIGSILPPLANDKKYVFSCIVNSNDTDANSCMVAFYADNNTQIARFQIDRNTRASIRTTQIVGAKKIYLYASSGYNQSAGDTATFADIQIELADVGGKNTEYEPYIEPTEYAVNEDGTVDGVTALNPTTTLTTDTVGAIVDVTYNRDANKVVTELVTRIAALESAVLK